MAYLTMVKAVQGKDWPYLRCMGRERVSFGAVFEPAYLFRASLATTQWATLSEQLIVAHRKPVEAMLMPQTTVPNE